MTLDQFRRYARQRLTGGFGPSVSGVVSTVAGRSVHATTFWTGTDWVVAIDLHRSHVEQRPAHYWLNRIGPARRNGHPTAVRHLLTCARAAARRNPCPLP